MKQSAATIATIAKTMPEVADMRAQRYMHVVDGSFKVSCLPTKPAMLALSKKLTKRHTFGTHKPLPQHKPLSRRYSASTFEAFVLDEEYSNAINYNRLYNRPVWLSWGETIVPLIRTAAVPHDDRFAVARTFRDNKLTPWNVYHLASGMSCSSDATDKAGALAKFAAIDADKIERAVKCASTVRVALHLIDLEES